MRVLNAFSPDAARFVGGCVRNAVMRKSSEQDDIDIASVFPPDEAKALLKQTGIKTIDTGLAHGTVTALIEGKPFEITVLRRDVKTDGRHAEIVYSRSYQEDSQRRDFTFNALYASPDGEISDYVNGIEDALAGRVRFIGVAEDRIKEDYLRILRFFRFYAVYGLVPPCSEGLAACALLCDGLKNIARERIRAEFFKWLKAPNALSALNHAHEQGVLNAFFDGNIFDSGISEKFTLLKDIDPHFILFLLSSGDVKRLKNDFRLTHKEMKDLEAFFTVEERIIASKEKAADFLECRFLYNDRLIQQIITLLHAKERIDTPQYHRFLRLLNLPLFDFTLDGKKLVAQGVKPGPGLGKKLKEARRAFILSLLQKAGEGFL